MQDPELERREADRSAADVDLPAVGVDGDIRLETQLRLMTPGGIGRMLGFTNQREEVPA